MDAFVKSLISVTLRQLKQSKKDLKIKALEVFAKVTPVLGFKHILYHHEKNQNLNPELMKNIVDGYFLNGDNKNDDDDLSTIKSFFLFKEGAH